MKWTERVLEMKASGVVSEADLADSRNYNCCLVGEAAHLLGQTWRNYRGESRANYDTVGRLLDNRTGINDVGGTFPRALQDGRLDEAEQLCYAVEDAVLQLKREGGGIS